VSQQGSVGGDGRGLVVDIAAVQGGDAAAAEFATERAVALLDAGSVRALLLDPLRAVPGSLHPALLRSPLLRWNTATELRRAALRGAGAVATPDRAAPDGLVLRDLDVRSVHVALVGALPPVTSASAASNALVAEALAQRCRVDVADDGQPDPSWLSRVGARHVQVEALERQGLAWAYDAVVHCVGASPADLPALRSARRVPGVLWLHDLALAAPHRIEARTAPEPGAALAALLRRVYADRAPSTVLERLDGGDAAAFDAAAERRYGLLLTGEVVRQARAVVVASESAVRRLRLDQGPGAPCPSVFVVPPRDGQAAADALLRIVSGLLAAEGGEAAA
jgi:hypothetical protein